MWVIKSNLQCSVESNSGLLWFRFTSLCDWFGKLALLFQPIRCKNFPALWAVCSFLPEFSLAPKGIFLSSDWPLWFLWLWIFRRSTEKCSTYSSLVPCCIFKLRNILWRLFKTTSIPFWIFKQANIPRKSSLITISILCRFALCFPFPPFVSLQKFRSTMVHQGKSEFNLLIFSYLQMSH